MLIVLSWEGLGGDVGGLGLFAGYDDGDFEGCLLSEGFQGAGELLAVGRAFFVVFLVLCQSYCRMCDEDSCERTFGSLLMVGTRKFAIVAILLLELSGMSLDEKGADGPWTRARGQVYKFERAIVNVVMVLFGVSECLLRVKQGVARYLSSFIHAACCLLFAYRRLSPHH